VRGLGLRVRGEHLLLVRPRRPRAAARPRRQHVRGVLVDDGRALVGGHPLGVGGVRGQRGGEVGLRGGGARAGGGRRCVEHRQRAVVHISLVSRHHGQHMRHHRSGCGHHPALRHYAAHGALAGVVLHVGVRSARHQHLPSVAREVLRKHVRRSQAVLHGVGHERGLLRRLGGLGPCGGRGSRRGSGGSSSDRRGSSGRSGSRRRRNELHRQWVQSFFLLPGSTRVLGSLRGCSRRLCLWLAICTRDWRCGASGHGR